MPDEIVIGIDIGTSASKAVAVTSTGEFLGRARTEYPMHHPHSGWNENDPRDWIAAVESVVLDLTRQVRDHPGQIRALAIVGQRDPLVPLDEAGAPVAPAISWTDHRTQHQLNEVQGHVGRERLIEITGGRPVVGGGLLNALWLREHSPGAWAQTRRLASPKDYVRTAMGGTRATDVTTPTRSLAFDVTRRTWSDEVLDVVGVEASLFDPVAAEPTDAGGVLAPDLAQRLGLPAGVLLATGCADDHAATIGSGGVEAGEWSIGTGTCSSWRHVSSVFQPDLQGHVDCSPHAVPGLFIREATIDSVGSTLRWFRDELSGTNSYEDIMTMAATVPPGAEGVCCLPFVDGAQRAPYFQEGVSAAFLGITGRHTTAHLARAVIEAVAYLYLPTYALMGATLTDQLTIVDGEASSAFWNQVKADVLGRPVRTPHVLDAAAMGAAVLATVAAGLHDDVVSAARAMVRWRPLVEPDTARHSRYAVLAEQFAALCSAVLAVPRTIDSASG